VIDVELPREADERGFDDVGFDVVVRVAVGLVVVRVAVGRGAVVVVVGTGLGGGEVVVGAVVAPGTVMVTLAESEDNPAG